MAVRELVYRLTAAPSASPQQLSLQLAAAGPSILADTTVTHLDDAGHVWRTLSVTGTAADIARAAAVFAAYQPPFVVEKQVLGATPRRLILWYKYRADKVPGVSHTRLAFRLLGRDTILTDRAQGRQLTLRILARSGRSLEQYLDQVRATPGLRFDLLYLGPPRELGVARLTAPEEETLRAAASLGYYEVPRQAGVRAVAEATGLSPSAAGYRLRRAEGKLVAAYLDA